jgi:hypothetical protein
MGEGMVLSPLCAKGTPAGVPPKEMKMEENKKGLAAYVLGGAQILTAVAVATLAVKSFTGLTPGGASLRARARRQIS